MVRISYGRQRNETLDYVQAMLGQLSVMARGERCDMLTYLIEMAYVEVSDILRGQYPPQVQSKESSPPTHEQRNAPS
ncbi:hypothetical protein [Chelativorans salis]|uniref:Uncharacterized protein n=1 Tax=Chelativorans salis TaxID=2978478 RepID=A0ABT2LMK0_9HYPH|nr:hypothetical protein [Chelativorans sp. EGI FJ00035]MCT7375677.1 hypothetical protein [Chelativorans sp. EGI FJ00035]